MLSLAGLEVAMPHITENEFKKRFTSLILGARDFPKKQKDRHILLKSSTLGLTPGETYTESQINDNLYEWTSVYGGNFGLDHVTMRRYLIDDGYIQRDPAGGSYQLGASELEFTYDDSITGLDLEEIIQQAKLERERKKQQYMKKG